MALLGSTLTARERLARQISDKAKRDYLLALVVGAGSVSMGVVFRFFPAGVEGRC
jgi:hypothetical protein